MKYYGLLFSSSSPGTSRPVTEDKESVEDSKASVKEQKEISTTSLEVKFAHLDAKLRPYVPREKLLY